MGDVELLLLRIDHFRDRAAYVAELRRWLAELRVAHGRVISLGAELQLLFVAATAAQNSRLLQFFGARPIDCNSRGERVVDRFVDVLGRKAVDACSCRGFLEMHVLSAALLQKVLVQDWRAEQAWLDAALATPRTRAFLEWKEAAKQARKERRKREGQEKQQERDAKRVKREQEQKAKAEEQEAEAEAEAAETETDKPVADSKTDETEEQQTASAAPPSQQKQEQTSTQQQQQSPGPKQQQQTTPKQQQQSPGPKQQQQSPGPKQHQRPGPKKPANKNRKRRNKASPAAGHKVAS